MPRSPSAADAYLALRIAQVAILTDGEAGDIAAFGQAMRDLPKDIFVGIGIVGFGEEHDKTLRSLMPFVRAQPRVKIIQLRSRGGTPGGTGAESNGHQIAEALRSMFQDAKISPAGWMSE